MASSISSPEPQSHPASRPMRKDFANIPLHENGRGTPLPQYEKTQSVPFTLSLQEEKEKPGQFQLVVNVDPQYQKSHTSGPPRTSPSKKLVANLQEAPSLGYNVSQLYHTQKSSPPTTPQEGRHEWSELDAIPPQFLEKVVPDWDLTFLRSGSTASTQSRKLADIKARIKKSGKGFVVRLLKGSNTDASEVAEVNLGRGSPEQLLPVLELDTNSAPVELDSTEPIFQKPIFELGSGEPSIQTSVEKLIPASDVSHWLSQTSPEPRVRSTAFEDGFSDAETLLPDVRSIADRMEEHTDIEPMSTYSSCIPTRSNSVLSIVKTPTRGLSVVGPVRKVEKGTRVRGKGKTTRFDLTRTGAHKSTKENSPNVSILEDILSEISESQPAPPSRSPGSSLLKPPRFDETSEEESHHVQARKHPKQIMDQEPEKPRIRRQSSAPDSRQEVNSKTRLRIQTNVARPNSANTSPLTRKKRSPRSSSKPIPSLPVGQTPKRKSPKESPTSSDPDPSDGIREALEIAFGTVEDDLGSSRSEASRSIPGTEASFKDGEVGEIPLPAELELKPAPAMFRSPFATFCGLALGAMLDKVVEGAHFVRAAYGGEPPVQPNHVRVRWTCACGEPLYDDFIERRPGAARLLEAFLNRPRTHAPSSPHSRSSTSTSMASIFDSVSRASTLATPASTFGGPSPWGKMSESSKYSPTRMKSSSYNIPMPSFVEEAWLLTCANEGRFTPKIVHVDVNKARVKSDKDLALALREHYEQLNRRWLKWARLRGLTTIEFVQFEVHRNRFADIRASPSMPPVSSTNDNSPSKHPYNFEPVDLVPPVGSAYLLHLFKHPEDYDGELITYLRAPKRRERLEFGMGWGINLVEGFLAQKVWTFTMACFGAGSGIFAVLWTVKKQDVQGAFGVAGWIVTLAALILGGIQAWLEG